jgi:hypothetical protein
MQLIVVAFHELASKSITEQYDSHTEQLLTYFMKYIAK